MCGVAAHQNEDEIAMQETKLVFTPQGLKAVLTSQALCRLLTVAVLAWLIAAGFVAPLPIWAQRANEAVPHLCTAPKLTCTDGQSFAAVLAVTGRTAGCGCGQGVFGEYGCPTLPGGFTIAAYISAAPATGAMAICTVPTILLQWVYGSGSSAMLAKHAAPEWLLGLAQPTLFIFTASFLASLIATPCAFPSAHAVVYLMLGLAQAAHLGVMAVVMLVDGDRLGGRITLAVANTGVLAALLFLATYHPGITLAAGYDVPSFSPPDVPRLPFILETVALLSMFGMTPCMLLHDVLGDNRPAKPRPVIAWAAASSSTAVPSSPPPGGGARRAGFGSMH